MQFQVVLLGTAGSIPTKSRNLPCIAIRRKGELILFDCGEGAQRQFIRAGIGFPAKFKIFISHLHGDHVLGLPGLLQTMSLMGRNAPLEVYGPRGIIKFFKALRETVRFLLTFKVTVFEVGEGLIYEGDDYVINACWTNHSIPCLAFSLEEHPKPGKFYPERAIKLGVPKGPLWKRLQMGFPVELKNGRVVRPEEVLGPMRPGLKLVYSGDTAPSEKVVELARNADLLIHEATFDDDLAEKAGEDKHSTASQAAEVALKANVKFLVLTHISARYEGDDSKLLNQARSVFPKVIIGRDFQVIELFPEFKVGFIET